MINYPQFLFLTTQPSLYHDLFHWLLQLNLNRKTGGAAVDQPLAIFLITSQPVLRSTTKTAPPLPPSREHSHS